MSLIEEEVLSLKKAMAALERRVAELEQALIAEIGWRDVDQGKVKSLEQVKEELGHRSQRTEDEQ
ncbi:MAG: hypothetical protein CMK74_06005 [Pseudomonadales bacterium]|nr:hypothetical protein [Pseudomonadales bacterium]|tara:strand:+ start:2981 stop:3175 length:195 start_codon:yes stop_codon:yes gene_type:complete